MKSSLKGSFLFFDKIMLAKHNFSCVVAGVTEGNLRYALSFSDVTEGGKERRTGAESK